MRTNVSLASVALAAGCAAGANAAIILDQPSGIGTAASQQFEPAYTAYDCAGFDDFTLLSTWDLTTLTVYGSEGGGGAGSNTNVSLWIHTSPVYQTGTQVFGTQVGSDLVFDLTGITLTAGTYWLSAQVNRAFAGGGGQWFWRSSSTTNGAAALWQNPGDGFGNGTGLIPASGISGEYDLAFTLEGNKIPAPGAIALLGLAGLCGRRRRN